MNSRDRILTAVQANKPAELPLPPLPDFAGEASVERFAEILASIGGRAIRLAPGASLAAAVHALYPTDGLIASRLIPATVAIDEQTPIEVLAAVELAVLQGELGTAENGTVWVPEPNMLHRALPFITQHLVLVLDHRQLVATMHQAYARVGSTGDYGVFIAGPSKTADIEQSLVVGAHGARSLIVLLQ